MAYGQTIEVFFSVVLWCLLELTPLQRYEDTSCPKRKSKQKLFHKVFETIFFLLQKNICTRKQLVGVLKNTILVDYRHVKLYYVQKCTNFHFCQQEVTDLAM